MKVTEAREALIKTIDDAIASLKEKGLEVEKNCFLADRDLLPTKGEEGASLIVADITVCAPDTDEKVIMECAVSIEEGEVLNDEIIREITLLRQNIKEITDKIDEVGSAKDAFAILAKEEEPEVADAPVASNKSFYIYAGIAAIVILIIAALAKAL